VQPVQALKTNNVTHAQKEDSYMDLFVEQPALTENSPIQQTTDVTLVITLVEHALLVDKTLVKLVFQEDILKTPLVFLNALMVYGKIRTCGDVKLVINHVKAVKDLVPTNVHHALMEHS